MGSASLVTTAALLGAENIPTLALLVAAQSRECTKTIELYIRSGKFCDLLILSQQHYLYLSTKLKINRRWNTELNVKNDTASQKQTCKETDKPETLETKG